MWQCVGKGWHLGMHMQCTVHVEQRMRCHTAALLR